MSSLTFGQAILLYLVNPILTLLVIVILIGVVLSWLIAFDVVNPRNQLVATLWRMSSALTEPLLRPIRGVIPPLGGMDLSPLILLLLIYFIQNYVVGQVLMRALG